MAEVETSKRYDVSGDELWERIGDPARISDEEAVRLVRGIFQSGLVALGLET